MSVGALEALAGNWSEFLGTLRLAGRLSHPLPGLSSSPLSHTDIVSDVPGRISSVTGVAPGGQEDVVQGCLGNRPRSGSWTVDCPSGLHRGVRRCVCMGSLPRDSSASVPGRLAGLRLFGGGGQKERMVSPLSGGEGPASSLGLAVNRPARDELQRDTSPVLFPFPGSPGGLRGYVLSSLGQSGPLCVSTLSSGGTSGGSCQRDPQSLHDSSRPPLAGEGMVRRPSHSTDRTASGASVVGPVVAAAPLPTGSTIASMR